MKSDATYTPIRCAVGEYICAHCGGTIELAEDFYVFTFADRKETELVCEPCHDDDVRGTASRGVDMGEEEEQEDSERIGEQ